MSDLRKEINDLKSIVVAYGENDRASVQYRDIQSRFSKIDVDLQTKVDVDSTLRADYQVIYWFFVCFKKLIFLSFTLWSLSVSLCL